MWTDIVTDFGPGRADVDTEIGTHIGSDIGSDIGSGLHTIRQVNAA